MMWAFVLFPIIAGAGYLLVAAAPQNIRQQVPPVILQWIPFGVSMWGIITISDLYNPSILYMFGYSMLLFGLLSRIARPNDQTARLAIAVGGGMLVLPFLSMLGTAFAFSGGVSVLGPIGIFGSIDALLGFLVTALGIFCIVFIVPPQNLPPALRAMDAFGPIICAILLAWLVVHPIIVGLGIIIVWDPITGLLMLARLLMFVGAFVGVFLMASPNVYEAMFGEPVMRRKPLGAVLMMFVPLFGILFMVYWLIETKNELKKRTGMDLLPAWWLAIPGGGIYYLWKWSFAVEKATGFKQMNAFLFMMFIAPYGVWVLQEKFNQLEGGGLPPAQAVGPGGYPPQAPGGYPQQGGYPPPGGGYPPQQ